MKDIQQRCARTNPHVVLDDDELGDETIGMNTHLVPYAIVSLQHGMAANTYIVTDGIVLPDEDSVPRLEIVPYLGSSVDDGVGADDSVVALDKLVPLPPQRQKA